MSTESDRVRLQALEQRLQQLSDQLEIQQLLAGYGPLVDAGAADAVARMWSADGSYRVEGWEMQGRAEVAAMVTSTAHQALIAAGSAHFLGPARVRVDGDDAEAVCESLLIRYRDGGWIPARASANHFTLARIDGRWQITARVTRALDGSPAARELLRRADDGARGSDDAVDA